MSSHDKMILNRFFDEYVNKNRFFLQRLQQPAQLLNLPFYGGAKGQVLQIMKDPAGTILSQVIVPEESNPVDSNQAIERDNESKNAKADFSNSLFNIQASAQRLVELQQNTKRTGQLKAEDQKLYASNLAILGESATNLAQLGANGDRDLSELFLSNKIRANDKNKRKENVREEEDEDVGEEQEGDTSSSAGQEEADTVQVNGPDSASVAEAKPVGVAIAGEGGVASSKPVATAVVGPGGLAIARPVATAIAGVDPNNIGFGNKIPIPTGRLQTTQRREIMREYMKNSEKTPEQLYPIDFTIL